MGFDSAGWGNAAAVPGKTGGLRLFNCEASFLQDYPPHIEGADTCCVAGTIEAEGEQNERSNEY